MSNVKISQLPAGAPTQSGDLLPIARGNGNYSLSASDLYNYNTATTNSLASGSPAQQTDKIGIIRSGAPLTLQVSDIFNVTSSSYNYVVDTGSVNNIVVNTTNPSSFVATPGILLSVKMAATNTGGMTLTLNGVGPTPIILPNGSAIPQNTVFINSIVQFVFTGLTWQIVANAAGVSNGVYYGPYASNPTTRPDGTAVQVGDQYFNTTSSSMLVYTSTGWLDYMGACATSAALASTYASTATTAATNAQLAAQASGNIVFYNTYALANAAVASLPNLQVVEVWADETKNYTTTMYRKESGVLVFKIYVVNPGGQTLQSAYAKGTGVISQVGDSNTDDQFGRPGWYLAYNIEWFGSHAIFEGWTNYNIGQNGSALQTWVASIPNGNSSTPVTQRGQAWAAVNANPDIIVIDLGTNDVGQNSTRNTNGTIPVLTANLATLINFYLANTSAAIWLRMPQPFAYESFGSTVTWSSAAEAAECSNRLKVVYNAWKGVNPRVTVYDSHTDLFGDSCDNKAVNCLDPVTGVPMLDDSLHCSNTGFRRFCQRMARQLLPSARKIENFITTPNANWLATAGGIPVYVANLEVSGTLLSIYSDPGKVLYGPLQNLLTVDNNHAQVDLNQNDASFAGGNYGNYFGLRTWSTLPVTIYFPASGNTYNCTAFTYSSTVVGGSNQYFDKYSITGATVTDTGPAIIYVTNWYNNPYISPDMITVNVDRNTDIIVPFRPKRRCFAELFAVEAGRTPSVGFGGSFDLYVISGNNGVTTGTLAYSTTFGASLAFGAGTVNATNYPNGVVLDCRGGSWFGFRLTNFSNFGTSTTQGNVMLYIRYSPV